MRRVLLLVTDLQPGGTPLRIVRTARELPKYGFEPVVGCLAAAGPLSETLRGEGIETFACDARHRLDVGALSRLVGIVRRYDPDMIHSTLFHSNVAARMVGRSGRARPIVTGSATIEIERRTHRLGEALTSGFSDWHVANSVAVAEHLCEELGFSRERMVVIPNAVDVGRIDAAAPIDRREWGIASDRPMVVWVGRMDVVKGLDTLLDAIELVRCERACSLVLCGDGPERGRVEARAGGLADIHFVGWQAAPAAWLKAADVMVFPSRTEGSPNALLEAMAAGCAVVASDIAPCRELIEPGVSGELAEVGDATGFVRAIIRLLGDAGLRSREVESARRAVEASHAVGTVMSKLSGFYDLVLCGGTAAKRILARYEPPANNGLT